MYTWLESKKLIGIRARGRPVIHIPEDQLSLLLSFSFLKLVELEGGGVPLPP